MENFDRITVIECPYQINIKPSLYYPIKPVLRKLFIVPFLILFLEANGQEPSFTQYLAAPNLLNPATTGLYNGKYQFQSNLKNQWSQVMYPYQTGVIDAQAHVLDGYIGANDIFSVSFLGSLDKSNDGGYKKSQVGGTLSYHKSLDGEGLNHLGIGVQAIYNNVTLDYTRLTFQSQFQPYIGYDPTISNGEGAGFTNGAFDFSTGVLYSYFDEDINAYLGAGAFHLNNPPIQMPTGSFSIPTRLTFHGGLSFPVSELDRLYSSLSHQKSTDLSSTIISCPTINISNRKNNYVIKIIDSAGCTITDRLEIWGFIGNNIFLPRAFIPNNASVAENRILKPVYVGIKEIRYFKVFDRMGHEVFTTNSMSQYWDGTTNGKELPTETYSWIILAIDEQGKQLIRKGNVTLIRQ